MALGFIIFFSLQTIAEELVETSVTIAPDWQPITSSSSKHADLRCRQCGGSFVDPLRDNAKAGQLDESAIEVAADDTEVTEDTLLARGNVKLKQGNRRLVADSVEIDRKTGKAVAAGQVLVREPGVVMAGTRVNYDSESNVTSLRNAKYVLHDSQFHGTAESLSRDAQGNIVVSEGAMTFCAPDNPYWTLEANKLKIFPQLGEGHATGARLRIGQTPVLYLPWIRFPTDSRRKTGLLFPDIGSDSRGGIDITQPIYFNLAPNYDALYRPRYIEERGLLHQAQGRWLSETVGLWELNGAWIGDDERYQNANPDIDANRWLFNTQHEGQFGPAWRTKIAYTRVSDPEYIRDIENNRLSAQRQTALQQLGRVDWLGEDWQVRLDGNNSSRWRMTSAMTTKKCPRSLLAGEALTTGGVSNRFYSRSFLTLTATRNPSPGSVCI